MKKRFLALLVCVMLVFASANTIIAKESSSQGILNLTLADAKSMAVENSNAIRSLESKRLDLQEQAADYQDKMESFKKVYDVYKDYEKLKNKYNSTMGKETTKSYFELSTALAQEQQTLADLNKQLEALVPDTDAYTNKQQEILALKTKIESDTSSIASLLTANGGSLTDSDLDKIISVKEYYTMQAYEDVLKNAGIKDKLNNKEEYTNFIYPLKVVPLSYASGIKSLEEGKKLAALSIEQGVVKLYNGLLTIKSYEDLLNKSYELAKEQTRQTTVRLSFGKATQSELEQIKNNENIESLKFLNMKTKYEKSMLTLKQLLGVSYDCRINLLDKKYSVPRQKELSEYIKSAIANRNEITSIVRDGEYSLETLKIIEDYFSENDEYYVLQLDKIQQNRIEVQIKKKLIEDEIRFAYSDVLNKEDIYHKNQAALLDAEAQIKHMKLYRNAGYITDTVLTQLEMQRIQKENELKTAYKDYIDSLNEIDKASSIGPAYSLSKGGQ